MFISSVEYPYNTLNLAKGFGLHSEKSIFKGNLSNPSHISEFGVPLKAYIFYKTSWELSF